MIDGRKGITNTAKKSIFYLPWYVTMKKKTFNPYDNSEIQKSSHHKLLTLKFDAKAIANK